MRRRNGTAPAQALSRATIVIRPAYGDDDRDLIRLAALDSASVPSGAVLLGEVDGELRAALSLRDGTALADPFFPTTHLLALLRSHASVAPAQPRHRSYGLRLAGRLA
jgi:hypothetical protein